ncbi:MAG: exonuclease domain-containing protein [Ruminococcaceae bacterium]|nr:exonuclease domain-containing protein [Oscillospiraceae bacterium]
MIVMDLEWNRGYDKKKLDEILQIGAVRIDAPGGAVRGTFCAYIKPRIHKRFDPGARKLPDLRRSVEEGVAFPEAWRDFTAWCGDDRVFAFWGPDDFSVLRQSCAFWGVPCIEPERVYNFQRAFAHACGAGSAMMALWRVVDYLGIPAVYDFHNALYDALYTALTGEWLREEDLADVAAPKPKREKPSRAERRRRKAAATPQDAPAAEPPADAAETQKAAAPKKAKRRRRRRKKEQKVDINQLLPNAAEHDILAAGQA